MADELTHLRGQSGLARQNFAPPRVLVGHPQRSPAEFRSPDQPGSPGLGQSVRQHRKYAVPELERVQGLAAIMQQGGAKQDVAVVGR